MILSNPLDLLIPLNPPPHGGKGGVVARPLTRLGAAAAATVRTGIVATAARKSGTGGGAALRGQGATRKSAVIPGSVGAAGADLDPERETGAEPGPEIAAVTAETDKRRKRGKGVGMTEVAVIVVAANTNRKPLAKI